MQQIYLKSMFMFFMFLSFYINENLLFLFVYKVNSIPYKWKIFPDSKKHAHIVTQE